MRDVELWILAYLLNSLWQIPLLFAAGWLAARALRSAGAEAEHRVWVTTLTLQCLLPAGSIFPIDWLRAFSRLSWNASRASHAYVSVTMGGELDSLQFHCRPFSWEWPQSCMPP